MERWKASAKLEDVGPSYGYDNDNAHARVVVPVGLHAFTILAAYLSLQDASSHGCAPTSYLQVQ
jgi:hypothetical protein